MTDGLSEGRRLTGPVRKLAKFMQHETAIALFHLELGDVRAAFEPKRGMNARNVFAEFNQGPSRDGGGGGS